MTTLILQGPDLDRGHAQAIHARLGGELAERKGHFRLRLESPPGAAALAELRAACDANIVPRGFARTAIRLFITDMDSTLINIECVDEIADFIGVKEQVAAITAAAMRGELDFETSLTRRIALLEGLDAGALDHVYRERLRLNPGAEDLLAGLRAAGIKTALVSGGFTFFTERLRLRLGLDYTLANELEIEDGRLTGRVTGDIVGAEAKAGFLLRLCGQLGIEPRQAIAAGDGANDLKMLKLSGLSVAYHAKPKVRQAADVVLNFSGLDAILAYLEE